MIKVTFDKIDEVMNNIIKEELERVDKVIKKVTNNIANEALKDVKIKSPKNMKSKKAKHYAEDWRKKVKKGRLNYNATIHNKQYQLTHLLENGHFSFNQYGGAYKYVKGRPHIKPVQDKVNEKYEDRLIKELKL